MILRRRIRDDGVDGDFYEIGNDNEYENGF